MRLERITLKTFISIADLFHHIPNVSSEILRKGFSSRRGSRAPPGLGTHPRKIPEGVGSRSMTTSNVLNNTSLHPLALQKISGIVVPLWGSGDVLRSHRRSVANWGRFIYLE